MLAGGLLLALETWVRRRPAHYVAAGIVLAALTGVVLVSAAYRLRLYQEAYGWTELRFYALAIIAWLGIGLVGATVTVLTDRSHRLPHVLGVSAVAVALVLSAVGPVRFVAEQNVARAVDPTLVPPDGQTGLDTAYLWRWTTTPSSRSSWGCRASTPTPAVPSPASSNPAGARSPATRTRTGRSGTSRAPARPSCSPMPRSAAILER